MEEEMHTYSPSVSLFHVLCICIFFGGGGGSFAVAVSIN